AVARRAAGGRTGSFAALGQRQVDLLERRPPDAQPLELAALGERLRGQCVETTTSSPSRRYRISVGGDSPESSAGRPIATIVPSRRTATRSESCSASSR